MPNHPKGLYSCCPILTKSLVRARKKKEKRILYVFDFDHTILNENSDTAIMTLLRTPIPEEVRAFYNGSNWTEYMDLLMKFIAEQGISIGLIKQRIRELSFAPGMATLLERIRVSCLQHLGSRLIIISDANNFFIESALSKQNPPIIPNKIISNHAVGTTTTHRTGHDGTQKDIKYLKIEAYEFQDTCPICPPNLCKGNALNNYISKEGPFDIVYYVGDGRNDICAAMALTTKDTLFVRRGYTMEKTIAKGKVRDTEINIQAQVVYYTHGSEIQSIMKL